jgi:hypothetical protein
MLMMASTTSISTTVKPRDLLICWLLHLPAYAVPV